MVLEGKNIVVLGLGGSGLAAVRLALARGATVVGVDECDTDSLRERGIEMERLGARIMLGSGVCLCDLEPDMVVISPGVLPTGTLGRWANQGRWAVVSELEFGWLFMRDIPLVAITGTNGKTTTTELCAALLRSRFSEVGLAGNIGYPVASLAMDELRPEINVFEVSSFQLERINEFAPRVGILTNVTPDHLERYSSMMEYQQTKIRMFEMMPSDGLIIVEYNALDAVRQNRTVCAPIISYSARCSDADICVEDGWIVCRKNVLPMGRWMRIADLPFAGAHNVENVMAAMSAALYSGVSLEKAVQVVHSFSLSGHRCQKIGVVNGVCYIDDSKATNLDATKCALEMCPAKKCVWLIAGGRYKGFDFEGLENLLRERVKGTILIGETRERIASQWKGTVPCVFADTMKDAVSYADKHAQSEDVVLLSPMCSSFDMFRSYAHRGDVFQSCVRQLESKERILHETIGEGTSTETRVAKC